MVRAGQEHLPRHGLPLRSLDLRPNHALRKSIEIFLQEMPHLRLRAMQRQDVGQCLEQRERDLKAMAGQSANAVPRRDFERLFLRLRLAERECETLRGELNSRPAYQESTRASSPHEEERPPQR